MATAAQYQNKVNAYFKASGLNATAADLALWTQNLVNTNGNVWSGLGLQQHVSQQAGWGNNVPFSTALATARVNGILTNMLGNHVGVSQTVKDYYVNHLVAGSIKERGLVNAIINDLGLMPKVDGTYGSPAGWEAGPAGANSPALVTAAQRVAWESNVENLSGGEFLLSANTDYADGINSFNGVLPTAFKFTDNSEVVYAPAGTLQWADTLLDTNWGQAGKIRDADELYIGANRAFGLPGAGNAPTIRGIEHIIIQGEDAIAGTMDFGLTTFAQRIFVEGTLNGQQTLINLAGTGATRFDFSDARPSAGTNWGVTMVNPTNADSVIIGSAGSDILRGGNGDDSITSGLGNDVIYTGQGSDRVTLNGGNNTVHINDNVGGDINYITATAGTNNVIMGVASRVDLSGDNALGIGASTVGVNVQGSNGNDVIIGGQGSDVIRGGLGADNMTSGWASTTFVMALGDSVASTANTLAGAFANTQTIVFAGGVDVINGFTTGVDKLDVTTALNLTNLFGVNSAAALTANNNYFLRGDYVGNTFTINNAAGADTLVVTNAAANTIDNAGQTGMVILLGVTDLTAVDMV
ncbi:hypothetical protein SAMN06295888_106145 [Desulfonatronum zhilinae]|nr:hypothetical protein SAMN06295888_106145 [Desulfonatronum zhilinae]